MKREILLLSLLGLAAASCGSGTSASAMLGPMGGNLGSPDGASLVVPSGAVGADTNFTVTPTPDAPSPASATAVGTLYTMGPEGATFSTPVTVTLAVDLGKIPSGRSIADVVIYTAPAGSSSYTRLATTQVDSTHVSATTLHFSGFVPAVSTACGVVCGIGTSGGGSSGTDGGTTTTTTCTCTSTCNTDGTAPPACQMTGGGSSGGGSGGSSGGGSSGGSCTSTGIAYGVVCSGAACTCTPSGSAPAITCNASTTVEQIFAAYQACGEPGELVQPPPPLMGTSGGGSGTMCSSIAGGGCQGCSISCMPPTTAKCTPGMSSNNGCAAEPTCVCQ